MQHTKKQPGGKVSRQRKDAGAQQRAAESKNTRATVQPAQPVPADDEHLAYLTGRVLRATDD